MDFLDKVRLKVLSHATALNVGRVDAINHVNILSITGAINLETADAAFSVALQWFLAGARRERNHRLERAQFRNRLENFVTDVCLNFTLGDVNYGRFSRDAHFLGDGAQLQCEVNRWQRTHSQFQVT